MSMYKNQCKEAATRRVLLKRPKACNFIKKETLTQVFSCEFREISKNTFSYRTPLVAASECMINSICRIHSKIMQEFVS